MQTSPSAGRKLRIWMIALLVIFIILMAVVLVLWKIPVMSATNEDGSLLFSKRIDPHTEMTSYYLHSVEKCPMVEKFIIDQQNRIVLKESWNCNFGAGIESALPKGAKGSLENGYYKIRNINQVFEEIQFHPVDIAKQRLKIGDEEWRLYEEPFEGNTFILKTGKMRLVEYLLK